jgi:endonuclease G
MESRILELARQAAQRWHERGPQRPAEDSPERRAMFDEVSTRAVFIGNEAIFGENDFIDPSKVSASARLAGKTVARLVFPDGDTMRALGTAFLVAPDVLVTNNHVIETGAFAAKCEAQFGFELDDSGKLLDGSRFRLRPDRFFATSEELDYTFIGVEPRSDSGAVTEAFGWNRLLAYPGKILIGQPISIIQHPSGGPKKFVERSNELRDLLAVHAHYTTDTQPGSSGSPVFNSRWEVVALHHMGIPRISGNQLMAKDGRPWRDDMGMDALEWVANEGVRVTALVQHLRSQRLSGEQMQIVRGFTEIDEKAASSAALSGAAASTTRQQETTMSIKTDGVAGEFEGARQIFIFNAPATIIIGSGVAAGSVTAVQPDATPVPAAAPPGPDAEGVAIDPDYKNRPGYDPKFLGASLEVKPPSMSAQMAAKALKNSMAKPGADPLILPYHHFSIVMNGERKLAFWTGVNIDGAKARRPTRGSDKWSFDPRIPTDKQAGEKLYSNNPLDRGHLVRRLDPAWGTTRVAQLGNDDTFHFTNCSPQHEKLNQQTWAKLEDFLLDAADETNVKMTVFTGPVFADDDPEYRGVQIPRQFWKVAVMKANRANKLVAAAFLQSQATFIATLGREGFLDQKQRLDQVSVARVEQLTGLKFKLPAGADTFAANQPVGPESLSTAREIVTGDEIVMFSADDAEPGL